MMKTIHECIHRMHNPDLGILLLRLGLGAVFMYHGWMKFQAMDMTIGFFGQIGLAPFWAYVVTGVELFGGLLLILGIFVRYVGILLAVTMLVAVAKVHWGMGFNWMQGGYEYVLVLMFGSIALVTTGAGAYSLARYIKGCCDVDHCEGGMCVH